MNITLDKTEKVETLYNLKHGGHWLADRGVTTQRKYAKTYTLKEANATKKYYSKKGMLVEVVEVGHE